MFKKAAALAPINYISFAPLPISTSSSTFPRRPKFCSHSQYRTYADVKSDLSWPENGPNSRAPTPYEIFHLERDAPYSKHTFYRLVKMYHPDRHGREETHLGGLSHSVKLERYRLVVLAHELLSDPIKRSEYDRCGTGWVERNERWSRHRDYTTSATDRPFGFGAGYDASPFRNATWEDWERWHARHHGESDQAYNGNYVSQNGFASLILVFAVLAGVVQATQAGQYSLSLEDKVQMKNQETTSFMQNRAGGSNNLGHDGRIRLFLEKRDPTKYGLKDQEEGTYRKTFSDPMLPAPRNPT
ncbi:putative hsp40 co-chaperone [Phaeomoniella chlamydospora]|uniref:Putative hsp40 co-chaperone n=1 Tax=Phaeomoniella chlamydospora TaxID=158046 RepID=A0A0G2DY33_PHACM|nr:putative hsp40 co-chaperone [Phaeomoniella chlamydospora]